VDTSNSLFLFLIYRKKLYVGRKYEMRNNEVELAKQNYQKIKKLYKII